MTEKANKVITESLRINYNITFEQLDKNFNRIQQGEAIIEIEKGLDIAQSAHVKSMLSEMIVETKKRLEEIQNFSEVTPEFVEAGYITAEEAESITASVNIPEVKELEVKLAEFAKKYPVTKAAEQPVTDAPAATEQKPENHG